MSIRLSEDNHDSWVMCTTSAECKTVITAVLTVMSGMDPHMISGNPGFGLVVSYPVPRKRERSLHTCAQDVQITRMAII
jgi:hypothetical protein